MKKMKLKELINVRTGKLDANASSEDGKYPFFTCSKETLKIDTYSYDCECVLLAGNGDLNVKYYNGKFDAYQRTYILECKDDIISTKYLYYFMKEYLKVLRNQSIGGVVKYIKLANITEAIIPIYSKEEQKRIVDNLSKVERVLDIKNKQIEELQNFIKSQFVEMFGDPKINQKEWKKTYMEEYIDVLTDFSANGSYTTLDSKVVMYDEPNYAYMVRTIDLENKDYKNNIKYITKEVYEFLSKSKVYPNDIIMNKIGSAGKVYIMPDLDIPVSLGRNAFLIRFNDKILPYFIYFLLISEYGTNQIQRSVRGAVTKTITKEDVRKIKIIVPPITLQNQFSEIVKQIDKQKFESMIQLNMMEKIYNIINERRRYV